MFDRDGNAAMNLRIEVGAQIGGRPGQDRSDRAGKAPLLIGFVGRARRVPCSCGRHLGGHSHVGAMVFNRLEHGDGAPELLTFLGVRSRIFGAAPSDPACFGGENGLDQCRRGRGCAVDLGGRRAVEGNSGDPPCRIKVCGHGGCHVGLVGLDHQDIRAQTGHDDIGLTAGNDRCGARNGHLTIGVAPGHDRELFAKSNAADQGPVGQTWQEPLFDLRPRRRVDDCASCCGGHERTGSDERTELFDHDRQFGEPVTRSTEVFRNVKAKPAHLGHVRPKGRKGFVGCVEEVSIRHDRVDILQER